jgi:hypothetical protein
MFFQAGEISKVQGMRGLSKEIFLNWSIDLC